MDPLTMGAIVGGAGVAGNLYANSQNMASAKDQMDFQAAMMKNAHFNEMADLRKSGLNPMLSAMHGPSGASGAMAETQNPFAGISTGAETAIAIKQQNKDLEAKDAGIRNTNTDTANKEVQSALIQNQANATAKDIEAKTLSNRLLKETMDSQIKKAKADGDYSELNQIMGILGAGVSTAKDVINPLSGLIKLKGKK